MTVNRSIAPDFIIPEHITFPKPIKRTLQNGVHLYFIPTPEINAIRLEINADGMGWENKNEKKLSSFFTLHMLLEGTHQKSAEELDDFFDTYASEVEIISSFEYNGLALLTTKKHFATVLPVFRELLTEAVFPEKELAKRKSQKALNISIQREKTGVRGSQLFRQELFGKEHPYGQIADEGDVEIIKREDLLDFYKNHLWVNPEIFVTGNVTEEDIKLISDYLGDLPVLKKIIILPEFSNQKLQRVNEPWEKAVQSSIRIGCHLLPKNHPDYFGFWAFNVFLGGYFGGRLIKNIREDKGHTYGIYSSIGGLKSSDYWVVMADVIKGHTEEVILEIYKEIDKLQNEPVSSEELETVRNYMVGNLLSSFSSSFELISRFKSIHQAGLDLSYFEKQLDFIKNFRAEDIQAIGKKYLDKEQMVEIVVG
ncbi:M16 family metallopeptidase [Fontibacter flavus]|uniref:M16 family metallopeptidase n=1 Tax=Fontibacter flavus TaxID=654838 RepID=A0ABV6FY74_9BACT